MVFDDGLGSRIISNIKNISIDSSNNFPIVAKECERFITNKVFLNLFLACFYLTHLVNIQPHLNICHLGRNV